MTRPKNQSVLTQTAEVGGDDCCALERGEKRAEGTVNEALLRDRRVVSKLDICTRRMAASPDESGNNAL